AGGPAAGALAEISCRRLRLSEPQAQNLLRAQAEALRRYVSGFLRHRSAAALQRACRFKGQLLFASAASPAAQCRLSVDQREEVPGKRTSRATYRPLRSPWASRA